MRVLCSLISLALITLALTRSTHADNRKEARDAFASGEAADTRKDYRAAIEHYLRAYELAPHHFALYNIGIDYERLGEFRESAEWFNRYLKEAPQSPELDRVSKLLIELKLRPAKLTVTTKPPSARVFVNGQYSGSTPFSRIVKGGSVRVRVELAGQGEERDVILEFGEPRSIEFTLRTVAPAVGPTGTLEITGVPVGASVAVDDQVVGSLPTRVDVVPGQHTIKVTRNGYVPFETTATVAINQTTAVIARLVQGGATGVGGSAATIAIGYMFGAGLGINVLDGKPIGLFDFGVRAGQYDVALRAGKASGYLAIDFLFRWAISKKRFSPYFGVGYSYLSSTETETGTSTGKSASGYELVGGIRYDFTRAPTGSASVVVESGVRRHSTIPGGGDSATLVPVLASFQYTYGRSR